MAELTPTQRRVAGRIVGWLMIAAFVSALVGGVAWLVVTDRECRRSGGHPVRGVLRPIECIAPTGKP